MKTGVDYAGPFHVKIHKVQNSKKVKVYLCILFCFSTKAVHLEVDIDLKTEGYIGAQFRLTSRSGLCSDIYSYFGMHFIGAANKINKTMYAVIRDSTFKTQWDRFTKN